MALERRTPLARKTPLAPGKPLARKTPLARGTAPLARTTPLRATPPARTELARTTSEDRAPERARTETARTPRARRSPVDTGAMRAQRDAVLARDGGRCARCGIDVTTGAVGYNDHHRQGRGMGGRKGGARAAANLPARRLTLCGSGTTGCHGWVTEHPDAAERAGLVVRRGGGIDPARVPVLTWRGWVLLDDDGGLAASPAPPGQDARSLATLTR